MTVQVSLVPPDNVKDVWPEIAGFFRKAVKYTHGRYEVDDVLWLITDYNYPLWIAFEDDKIKGAVVTKINTYPRKKYLHLDFCGGVDGFKWKDAMLSTLRKWAKTNDCDGIEASGRPGWKRIFADEGFKGGTYAFELSLEQQES
jgi:hypothetical protein